MPYQVSPSTTVYSMGAGGSSVGSAVVVGTAVGVGVGSAVAPATGVAGVGLAAGVGVTGWGEASGITTPDESLGRPGGRTRSQRARTLPRSRARREARKKAPDGAALTGFRQSAQRSSPWSPQYGLPQRGQRWEASLSQR